MTQQNVGFPVWDPAHHVFHITSHTEWEAAAVGATYQPTAFADEGFTHCSTAAQAAGTLDRFFRGQTDTLLLVIRLDRLGNDALVWENLEGGEMLFPHIYGPLPVASVVGFVHVPHGDDGGFDTDAAISTERAPAMGGT